MKGIKNLIFDFGGVLINIDRTAWRVAFEKLGIDSIHENLGKSVFTPNFEQEFARISRSLTALL